MKEAGFRIDQPNTLFERVGEILEKYGAEKFLHGDNEECQKGREAYFEYFFISGFKRLSGKDWWIIQPKERFPDLLLISFIENPLSMEVLQYEHVMIPDHYKDVAEMLKNVTDKIEKKQYDTGGPCGLLVFSNNANSKAFEERLYQTLDKIHPFTEVWTTSLEFSDSVTIKKIIVSKVRPLPVIRFEFDFNDPSLYTYQTPPTCMEQVEEGGIKFLRIKEEAGVEFKKEAIRRRLRDYRGS
ncbi:MAG: hypothetical protein Q7S76_00400 [bacterium]|nr:hypothetical protein [bacterium]